MDRRRRVALKRVEKDMVKLYDDFFLRVQSQLGRISGASPDDVISLSDSLKMLSELQNQLDRAGLKKVTQSMGDELEELTDSALDYFEDFGIKRDAIAGLSPQALDGYIAIKEFDFGYKIERELLPKIQQSILDGNFGGLSRSQIYDSIAVLSENLSPAQVIVTVDDAFAGYQRAVHSEVADHLEMEIFLYLGPADEITSDQCNAMLEFDENGVEAMYYRDQISVDLHPNLRRDPMIGGGHPRCRHHFSPVTLDYAISQGFEPRK